ncbi:hypothetical protein U1Q18_015825 [Sarracenia purpurea var. burkii]
MISNTHIFISLIFFHFFIKTAQSSNNVSATNADSNVLACGSSSAATDANGRNWVPDSKFLASSENSITAAAQFQDPSLPSTIPYMTARIFTSSSTYVFSVSSKSRHWVRLHFYPSSYSNLNTSDAYCSVTANGFTLLRNFSASITSQALTQAYIIKEFSLLPIHSGSLNLTFTPSSSKNGAVAFVNGVEVISMPEIFQPAVMVGFAGESLEAENSSLQTMFRLNVGGQYIPATNDTGLSRTWYDDSPYLYGASFGVTSEADANVTIQYPSNVPKFIAPADVYRTSRTMGPTSKLNLNYNLTWVFQVDGNFTYLLRLHFCEYQLSKANQRVFDIFINNKTAQPAADVMAWVNSKKGVPVYKDFAIYVEKGNGDEEIWVALHPSVSSKPEFYDAILNGLEIFKFNDTSGNLAGPNPVPSLLQQKAVAKQVPRSFAPSRSNKIGVIVGGVVGGVTGFGLVVGLVVCLNHQKKPTSSGRKAASPSWLPLYGSSRTKSSSGSSRITALGGGLCRHFSLAEIKYATKNFNESENNPDGPKMVAEQKANDAFVMHTTLLSIEEEETEDSGNAIFSQIMNPQGR